jgi:uncharacterized protein YdaU (DUF1376 family)
VTKPTRDIAILCSAALHRNIPDRARMTTQHADDKRLPYFKFYPRDWLASATVMGLSLVEEATYIRLLCIAWTADGLPDDLHAVRKLTRLSAKQFTNFQNVIDTLFPVHDDGKRRNVRQEQERQAVAVKHVERSASGKRGAKKRWQMHGSAIGSAMPEPIATGWQTDSIYRGQSIERAVVANSSPRAPAHELAGLPTADTPDATPEVTKRSRLLAAAVNKGITERFGEQPTPMQASAAGTHRVVDALAEAGVDMEFAAGAIFECARTLQLARPPRSLGYFLQHVLDRWSAEHAHRDAAIFTPRAGAVPVPIADGDQLRFSAIRYARDGSAEWQAYCDSEGITWKEKLA